MFDLKLLQCFEVVMAERSVSRAATHLNLTQSATSHALNRLRRLFDDPLFIKGQGEMVPTGRAIELKPKVRQLLVDAQRLVQKPTPFDPSHARSQFTIMTADYVAYLLAPKVVQYLKENAPGVDVEFLAADPEHALHMFQKGQIDFRIGWWPDPPQALRSKLLFRDSLVCLVRRNHPQIKGGITIEQYLSAQHVRIRTSRSWVSTYAIDRAVAAFRRKLRVALRVQNALALSSAVSQSDLVATVPARLASSLVTKFPLQVIPLPIEVPNLRVALYWHESSHNETPYQWFRQLLVDLAKSL